MKSKVEVEDFSPNPPWLEMAIQSGWFRMFLPLDLGGICENMPSALTLLKEAALINGSLGWVVNLGSGASWFYPYVDHEMAKRCWGPSNAIVAGSGEKGKIEFTSHGGYRLSGHWIRCTAAPWASWFTLNAQTPEGQVWTCLVPKKDVILHPRQWQQFGLVHSGTFAIEVQDACLEPQQLFTLSKPLWNRGHFTEQWPFPLFARVCMSASFLGLWQGLYEAFLKERGKCSWHGTILKQSRAWENQLLKMTVPQPQPVLNLVSYHKKSMDLAMVLFREAGMRIGQVGHPLHIAWSDYMTAAHHPYLW